MAKITAPNPQFSGESASIKFTNGVAETDDTNLIIWFSENGYIVEETDEAKAKPAPKKKVK